MPALDRTGPAGLGPMTGGGRGWCNPYSPLYAGVGFAPYSPYRAWYAYWSYWGPPRAYGFRRLAWPWGRRFWGRSAGWGGRSRGWGRW
ncbi:MAG TPA: hypothetical protein EYP04_08760 [Anaerolineae bacterium]|nr:hypothetical protein [Anaerolineae bacterium]